MSIEQRQFRVLYKDFLSRIVDLDVLSTQGDLSNLMGRVMAVLAAVGGVFCNLGALQNVNGYEFVVSATVAAAGLFAVFAWNAVFPDKRDCLVLGPLPIHRRTMIVARLAAVATALGGIIFALNFLTGLFLVVMQGSLHDSARAFIAWWGTMAAAGVFVFCAVLSLQGLASQLLSWRRFLRVSGALQLLALFAVLALFFLTPPFALTIQRPSTLIQFLPSYWFTGLLLELKGNRDPKYAMLAAIALRDLSIAAASAAILYIAAWIRNVRRIAEAPDIAPSIRRFAWAKRILPSRPIDRAILLFTWRTIARSRQHRLLLAAYGGIGFALACAFSGSFFMGLTHDRWDRPNIPLMTAGLLLLAVAITGTRAIFVLPQTLAANWMLRITAIKNPAEYSRATRRTLLGLAAWPIWIAAAIVYLTIWPGRPALEHILVLVLAGLLISDLSLHQFRKIPFACSWLPGGPQFRLKMGIWMLIFVVFASLLTGIEFWAMQKFARFCVFAALLFLAERWAARRNAEFALSPANRLQFDELPPAEIFALDLRPDGEWSSDEAWAASIDPVEGRTFGQRLKRFAIGALIFLAAGLIYEQASEWRDHRKFPQVGSSVEIGGRSLNLYCSGEGTPTVILESNLGEPGYRWASVQRQIAEFTRACWYDRAGLGWSDPGPFPNHSDSIAHDLHRLLTAARIPRPYVLVGYAMGGFHVRVYRGFYPDEVSGMVLVNPMNEDMTIRIHNHIELFRPAVLLIHGIMGNEGFYRVLDDSPDSTMTMLRLQPKSVVASGKEPPLWVGGELARAGGRFGDIPVVVLSAGIQDQEEDEKLDQDHAWKMTLHASLAGLSARGRQIVLMNAGHRIPSQAPGSVVDATREVVMEARLRTPDRESR